MAKWLCRICGYMNEGPAPDVPCPICQADETWFVRMDENPDASSFIVSPDSEKTPTDPENGDE